MVVLVVAVDVVADTVVAVGVVSAAGLVDCSTVLVGDAMVEVSKLDVDFGASDVGFVDAVVVVI